MLLCLLLLLLCAAVGGDGENVFQILRHFLKNRTPSVLYCIVLIVGCPLLYCAVAVACCAVVVYGVAMDTLYRTIKFNKTWRMRFSSPTTRLGIRGGTFITTSIDFSLPESESTSIYKQLGNVRGSRR